MSINNEIYEMKEDKVTMKFKVEIQKMYNGSKCV